MVRQTPDWPRRKAGASWGEEGEETHPTSLRYVETGPTSSGNYRTTPRQAGYEELSVYVRQLPDYAGQAPA
ncbi:hypothetical protein ACFL45_02310 [Candidatus Neomarinimicrobiota bacterium]